MNTAPIYLVCGFPRSGTSMMMRALEAGGLPCLYDPSNDAQRNRESAIPGYAPNPHGFYELNNLQSLNWAAARGKVVKVVTGNLGVLPPLENFRIVYMKRDPTEIRRSYISVMGPMPHHPAMFYEVDRYEDTANGEIAQLSARYGDVTVLDYARVVADPVFCFSRLGWPIDVARAAATVDPTLYRHRGVA